jgi:FkbM family methyltransferase
LPDSLRAFGIARLKETARFYLGRPSYPFPEEGNIRLLKYLSPADTVVEVGAWRGASARMMSYVVKKVYAFEPHPKGFFFLKNIAEKNVVPINIGISDFEGRGKLYSPILLSPDPRGKITVKRLSSYTFEKPTVLFCDCEGSELSVLRGANLNEFRAVFVETHTESRGIALKDTLPETKVYLEKHYSRVDTLTTAVGERWVLSWRDMLLENTNRVSMPGQTHD